MHFHSHSPLRGKVIRRRRLHREKSRRLQCEHLEVRRLLTIFDVVNTGDAGVGSLRDAIQQANENPGLDTIEFSISEQSTPIQPLSPLPPISDMVVIDGTTQPGYDGVPVVEIDGGQAGPNAWGLRLEADDSLVRGLAINRFDGGGISITGNSNIVAGNFIGTDVSGTNANTEANPLAPSFTVTLLDESSLTYDAGSNFGGFVAMTDDGLGPFSGTPVQFQGTDSGGSSEMLGQASLVYRYRIEFADSTQLESVSVAGQAFNGPDSVLRLLDESMDVIAQLDTHGGNTRRVHTLDLDSVVGTVFFIDEFDTSGIWRYREAISINGSLPLPLGNGAGVEIVDGMSNLIGTNGDGIADDAEGNLISGNLRHGIEVLDADFTAISGNLIGVDVNGSRALGNTEDGISVRSSNVRIGTDADGVSDAAERNVISANGSFAISIRGDDSSSNTIAGNFIGTDATGLTDNRDAPGANGVTFSVSPETSDTFDVGTEFEGFISDSDDQLAPTEGMPVQFRGTDTGGSTEMLGDSSLIYRYRVEFDQVTSLESVSVTGAAFNGSDSVLRVLDENMEVLGSVPTIGDNRWDTQVLSLDDVEGTLFYIDEFDSSSTWRYRESIKINAPVRLGNWDGIYVAGPNNVIGGDTLAGRNIIAGSGGFFSAGRGVWLDTPAATGNQVKNNYIGTDVTGMVGLGNAGDGVSIVQGPSNTIGAPGAGNVISGNRRVGVWLSDQDATGNVIASNLIGTNAAGTGAIGNGLAGVELAETLGNIVGTNGDGVDDSAEGNVISANQIGVNINNLNRVGTLADADGMISGSIASESVTGQINQADLFSNGKCALGNWRHNRPVPGGGGQNYAIVGTGTLEVNTAGTFTFSLGGDDGGRLRIDANQDGVLDDLDNVVVDDSRHCFQDHPAEITLEAGTYGFEWTGFQGVGPSGFELAVAVGSGALLPVIAENGWKVLGNAIPHPQIQLQGPINVTAYYRSPIDVAPSIVAGNYIGTNESGTFGLGNRGDGVQLLGYSSRVGTNGDGVSDDAERNVISANNGSGVAVVGPDSGEHFIAGNYIGTDASGFGALGNALSGVRLTESSGNVVGTDGNGVGDDAERNVISANQNGVEINSRNAVRTLADADGMISGALASTTAAGQIDQSDLFGSGPCGSGNWPHDHEVPGSGGSNYAFVGTGTLEVTTAGTFSFSLGGDDGGRLRVDANQDGVLDDLDNVIADNSTHCFRDHPSEITLGVGTYSFEWTGFQGEGDSGFELAMAVGSAAPLPVIEGNGWKVLGDPIPHQEIQLEGPIDVTAYYRESTDAEPSIVAGNYIGTDASGTAGLGNLGEGVLLFGYNSRVGTNRDGTMRRCGTEHHLGQQR